MELTGINASQYLTFCLGEDIFAFEIASVREVLEMTKVTRVPRTPEFMRGVINLRGHVVPVIDLRVKLRMPEISDTLNTCIVIVELNLDGESTVVGMVVDSVQEVADIGLDDIEPAPSLGTRVKAELLTGMAKRDAEFIMLLDMDRVLTEDELETVSRGDLGQENSADPSTGNAVDMEHNDVSGKAV